MSDSDALVNEVVSTAYGCGAYTSDDDCDSYGSAVVEVLEQSSLTCVALLGVSERSD